MDRCRLAHLEAWITVQVACRMNEERREEFPYLLAMVRSSKSWREVR